MNPIYIEIDNNLIKSWKINTFDKKYKKCLVYDLKHFTDYWIYYKYSDGVVYFDGVINNDEKLFSIEQYQEKLFLSYKKAYWNNELLIKLKTGVEINKILSHLQLINNNIEITQEGLELLEWYDERIRIKL